MKKKRMILAVLLFVMVFSNLSPAGQTRAAQELDYGNFCITEGQSYSFKNAASGWYMNVKHAGKTNGTEINVWPLDMSDPVSQRYVFTIVDAENAIVRISPEPTKKQYLDVRLRGGKFEVGKSICLWTEDGSNNKNMRLEQQPDGSFYITFTEHPGYCIGAKSVEAAGTAQTALVVCKITGTAEQRWILCDKDGVPIEKQGSSQDLQKLDYGIFSISADKAYSLKNVSSGWFMNVKGAGKIDGTQINLYPLDMNEPITQRYVFTVVDATNKIVQISPEPTRNQYLDVRRGGKELAKGQKICTWSSDGDAIKNLKLELQSDGSFCLIFAENPRYCIGAKSVDAAKTKQTQLVVCEKSGAEEQRWVLCDENGNDIVELNTVTIDYQYAIKNDDVHTVIPVYTYLTKGYCKLGEAYDEMHSFQDGLCISCNAGEVYKIAGKYVAVKNIDVYDSNVNTSKKVKELQAGVEIELKSVEKNQFGCYWGKLLDDSGYISTSYTDIKRAELTEEEVRRNIETLYDKLDKGGMLYFTTTQEADSDPSCYKCNNGNVIKTDVFKRIFGEGIEVRYFPKHLTTENTGNESNSGYSCFGFACFAQWYIYKQDNTDTVNAKRIKKGKYQIEDLKELKAGDIIRIHIVKEKTYHHSMIFHSFVYDAKGDICGIRVLDSNFYNTNKVELHNIALNRTGWVGRNIYIE